jgi:hypothetical protein
LSQELLALIAELRAVDAAMDERIDALLRCSILAST